MTDLDLRPVVVYPERVLILATFRPAELSVLLDRPDNDVLAMPPGPACLLRELAWGDPARHAVVYTGLEW
ncbi:modular polyketide synthase [Alloactinosynnema sp. L-07]|uniref:hypothetical protein n=1 Tax=Alloactinosynnema sp. L-07 TaxID=1653480 RepID=UPI00065F091D|nr:hypothetical protein [Alloactinosynnema sp. L-07]CRK57240.1 modular polyketide synthase [Alloactinosynnema sp. L-07]